MTISFWAEHGTLADGMSVLIVPEGLKGRLEASKYWVKAEEKNRSLDQNALLHSVINKMARSQGWEAERRKQHLKSNYGLKDSNGELISTTKYSTQEMADFITELLAICAEYDVDVRKERTEWTQKTSEQ